MKCKEGFYLSNKTYTKEFKRSIFFPWERQRVTITERQMQIRRRKFLFGVVPLQRADTDLDWNTIANVVVTQNVSPFFLSLFLSLFLVDVGFSTLALKNQFLVGLLIVLLMSPIHIGVWYGLSMIIRYRLRIILQDKKIISLEISLREKEQAKILVYKVQKKLKKNK